MIFSQILADIKKTNRLTNQELADICQVSKGSIDKYLANAHSPSLDVVLRLAQRFNDYPWNSLFGQESSSGNIIKGNKNNTSGRDILMASEPEVRYESRIEALERENEALREALRAKEELLEMYRKQSNQ